MLKSDLVTALTQMRVERCNVTASKESGARRVVSGVDDFVAHRLRNIFQLCPLLYARREGRLNARTGERGSHLQGRLMPSNNPSGVGMHTVSKCAFASS